MNLFKSKLITIISAVVILFTTPTLLSAQELNLNGFSGTINTTLTSGLTVRTEGNDCLMQAGYNYSRTIADASTTALAPLGGATGQQYLATRSAAVIAATLNDATKNDAGCAQAQTDGYGNTSTDHLEYGSVNNDDGKLNFPNSGDVIDQTTKFFTAINGKTDSGLSVGISLIGNYNPVLDLNAPAFKQLTNKGKKELESDLQILDA
jgi:hypothetical protein